MIRILILFILMSFIILGPAYGQRTSVYSEINTHYKTGLRLFEQGVYVAARKEFEQVSNDQGLAFEPEYQTIRMYAQYYAAICALRLKVEDADLMVTEFIKTYRPDPIAEKANLEVANFHFDHKNFDQAIHYYKLMDTRGLPSETLSEVKFKIGYSYFNKKDFSNAATAFKQVKDLKTEYYYPSNYYLGMCQYYNKEYDASIQSFQIASKSKKYTDLVPYYIAQIYFSQAKYDQLINYAQPIISGSQKVDKAPLIRRMMGHAYFIKKDYKNALIYLEEFEKTNQRLEEEDYYALGYSNYVAGKYSKAIPYFSAISAQQNQLGQNSNYYLADSYLRAGDKLSARTAFYNVSRLPYQENIKEESLFNYGKLSAELGFDREAVTTLNTFGSNSSYYKDAQEIMADVLFRTKDYDNAIRIIESIKNPSERLKDVYQMVCYSRGLQLINEDRLAEANAFFTKAVDHPQDKKTQLASIYWQGDIAHRQLDYEKSISLTNKFLGQSGNSFSNLTESNLVYQANYLQGYNFLKTEKYPTAGEHFKKTIDQISKSTDPLSIQILSDAVLRAGDCAFKRNKYDDAQAYYQSSIKNKYAGNDYAKYQYAIIAGLKGNPADKSRLLEELVKQQPNSKYADEALYELAITYTDNNQADEAMAVLKRITKDYPQSNIFNRALIQSGLVTYNQGNKAQALIYYKEVFKHNPSKEESQEALTAIQEIYVDDMGQADEYIRFLETVPGYNLTNYSRDSLNYSIASRYFEDGQYERAVQAFTDYQQKFPNGINLLPALYRRAEANVLLKKYDPALADYEAVIIKGHNEYYDKALFKAATLAYNHAQNFDKAFRYYSELAKANIDEATLFDAQLGAMRSAYRIGRTQEVALYADKVLKNQQATPDHRATASFYAGKIAFDQKNYPKATENFNITIQTSENIQTAEARYLLGNILYIQRNLDQAEKMTRQAIQQNSDHPLWVAKGLILLSDIFSDKNDYFNAKAALEAVLENYKEDAEITKIAQEKLAIVKKKQLSTSKLKPDSLRTNSLFDNN